MLKRFVFYHCFPWVVITHLSIKLKPKYFTNLFLKVFPAKTRAQLINDAFYLAQANKLNSSLPLKLAQYLKSNENEYLPWYSFTASLEFFSKIFKTTSLKYDFDQYVFQLVKPIYFRLMWQNQPNDDPLTR